ncbi:MAG TPA: metal-binding protein, partial [Syntrophus sp. (in: bacteria)]|nr:metal-binding protein [Syntrophus sp. (in: bacteria)]
TLAEAVVQTGILFSQDCGGRGTCGKCRLRLLSGAVTPATEIEKKHRQDGHIQEREVLACQRQPLDHVTVYVENGSTARSSAQTGKDIDPGDGPVPVPHVLKQFRALPPPSLEDQTPDLERLRDALDADIAATPGVIATLPELLRKNEFNVTAVIFQDRLVAVEGGDTSGEAYGIAFDIGTTTVAGYLADLRTGALLDSVAATNRQARIGADVMTRVAHTLEDRDGLARLQGDVVASLNGMIAALLAQNGIDPSRLYLLTAAGNTVMSHLLLGIPPRALAQAPFVPAFRSRLVVPTRRLRLKAPAHARLLVLPNIASYVGSDITAAILATDMDRPRGIRLLIDLGTNGEIVLAQGLRRVTCSTAAGPAFEGAGVRQGMRAEAGAISAVRIGDDVRLSVVGGGAPRGICGSGLVDAVAELARIGIIDRGGRLCRAESCPAGIPRALARRLRTGGEGHAFLLAEGEAEVVLHQKDVRALQLAKGAIRAGIEILLDRWGLTAADLDGVLLAGAFGSRLRAESLLAIGLLPPLAPEKIRPVGNAAGLGAWLSLISMPQWERAAEIAAGTEHVELSGHPAFQSRFIEALDFPPGG